MAAPEDIQEFLIRDPGRIIINLDCLGMIAEVVIRWVFCGTTRIANAGSNDTIDAPKLGIWPPESAQCKGRSFRIMWCFEVYWGNGQISARIAFCQFHIAPLFRRSPRLI